ncbi:MAG: hypothetical protein KAI79_16740, partial [Bacteroidales bacterium]|nr:hypothetical protein [Bacteroidales bacterium]
DVEQILGRVLRLPYVSKHKVNLLNSSYVFTSSKNFIQTLDNIVVGLNKAGFSAKDFKIKEEQKEPEKEIHRQMDFADAFNQTTNEAETNEDLEISVDNIKDFANSEKSQEQLDKILNLAEKTSEEFEKTVVEYNKEENLIPTELKGKVKTYPIKEVFKKEVENFKLPTFFMEVIETSIFETKGTFIPLQKGTLLKGFDLSKEDHKINFSQTSSEMAVIDLAEGRKDEYTPKYKKVTNEVKEAFVEYISSLSPQGKINTIAGRLTKAMKNINEIADPVILEYIKKSISDLDSDKISELSNNEFFYARIIKNKIQKLANKYAEQQFVKLLDIGTVKCQESFEFRKKISPKNTVNGITKNLYVEEGEMNDFEKKVIYDIANLDSVVFWHRNLERGKGFLLNGFINHYPDFIVKMKNGKIILIETKGDHLDGSDSLQKLKLGEKWASKAGDNYRYFMVFNNAKLDGAKSVAQLMEILKDMK